jgi:hypothetical protein
VRSRGGGGSVLGAEAEVEEEEEEEEEAHPGVREEQQARELVDSILLRATLQYVNMMGTPNIAPNESNDPHAGGGGGGAGEGEAEAEAEAEGQGGRSSLLPKLSRCCPRAPQILLYNNIYIYIYTHTHTHTHTHTYIYRYIYICVYIYIYIYIMCILKQRVHLRRARNWADTPT